MAVEGAQPFRISLEAAADLSALQYYFVKVDANGKAAVCAAVTDIPCGVLQNKPTSGQAAEITVAGETKVSSDAALTAANVIGTAADGQAAAYAAGSDTTKYLVGQMLVSTGGADVIGTAIINCAGIGRGA